MNARSYCVKYYLLSDTKKLTTLNNVGVLVKSVLIDLRTHNFMHSKISVCAHCMHAHHHAHNLLSPVTTQSQGVPGTHLTHNSPVLLFYTP